VAAGGLFSEGVLGRAAAEPLGLLILLLPMAAVYAAIPATVPLTMTPREAGRRHLPLPLRALLLWAAMFAVSVAAGLPAIAFLRARYPATLPPCDLYGC
jgi:hypothetical protein